MEDLFTSSWVQ